MSSVALTPMAVRLYRLRAKLCLLLQFYAAAVKERMQHIHAAQKRHFAHLLFDMQTLRWIFPAPWQAKHTTAGIAELSFADWKQEW